MMRRALGAAALALCAGARLAAQEPTQPAVGNRVELVTRDGRRVIGTVAALEQNSIRLRQGNRRMDAVPVADVATFRTSNGRDRWRGARRGALAGALVGAAFVAYAVYEDSNFEGDNMIPGTLLAVPAAVVLTGVGAGIGAAIAAPDHWSAPAPLRVGAAWPPRGRSVRLGMTARF